MMEAARTSETSVDIYLTTRQYIPEDSELQMLYLLFRFHTGAESKMCFRQFPLGFKDLIKWGSISDTAVSDRRL
jgi:hypothetical protein